MNIGTYLPARHIATQVPNRKKKTSLFFIAASMLFATCLYSCSSDKKTDTTTGQVQQLKQQMDSLNSDRNNVQSQYNAARMQVDQLTTAKSVLDSQVAKKDAEIARLKREIHNDARKNKTLAAELKKAKDEISSLNTSIRSYLERIGVLEKQSADMEQEKNTWVRKFNALQELGSVLHASNIRLETIHLKHHGTKEKDTKRARKVDVLRVHFDIDENRIAENGAKDLYIIIKGPDGSLLGSPTSETFKSAKGQSMNYSLLKEVNLVQGEPVRNLSADWKQNGDYKKGTYNIDIYNGGYKIGGGNVTLK